MKKFVLSLLSILSVIAGRIEKTADEHDRKALERARKAVEKIKHWIDVYMVAPLVTLSVSISKGNKKIGRVLNVSLAPIITCANCSKCMLCCYDIKAVLQYVNVAKARARNTVILIRDREKYFSEIVKACEKRRTNKYLRWHVSGDIVDVDYFDHMVKIARMFPDFRFWTYTKAYHIVNKWCELNGKDSIPENLSVMFSEWKGVTMVNPFGFPVFRCVMHDEPEPVNGFKCPGNCDVCLKNGTGCPYHMDAYVNEH